MWQACSAEQAEWLSTGTSTTLVSQFNLTAPAIRASVQEAVASGADEQTLDARSVGRGPRAGASAAGRPGAANRVAVQSGTIWCCRKPRSDAARDRLACHAPRRRSTSLGLRHVSSRGLGISALVRRAPAAPARPWRRRCSRTTLQLDLYRIDLSSVVSKYIGETEKNLRRVFDAAEDGGAILFFDEADALFGKRSEVKDSHDRYANIEINYLLQRMESYRGLAVLATNMKSALDPAFLRRIRFVVNFPFPDEAQRAEIWRRAFPAGLRRRVSMPGSWRG